MLDILIPLVSVIIPSYNHSVYIKETILSAAAQRNDGFRFEIIVIDDGSTDGSPDLLRALRDSGVCDFKLVIKDNEGLCRTLNRAIREHSSGSYVAVLASDDAWSSEKLYKQMSLLLSTADTALCYSNGQRMDHPTNGKLLSRFTFSGRVKNQLTVFNFIPAGTILFSRDLYDKIAGFDETGLRLEDWDFVLRASNVTKFCCVNEPLLLYRVHGESTIVKMRFKGELFNEKLSVLLKNKKILNPFLFYLSVFLHFSFDKVLRPFIWFFSKLR